MAASWYFSPTASIPQGGASSLFIADFLVARIRVMVGLESRKALDRRVEASSRPSCMRAREKFMKRGTMMTEKFGALSHAFPALSDRLRWR